MSRPKIQYLIYNGLLWVPQIGGEYGHKRGATGPYCPNCHAYPRECFQRVNYDEPAEGPFILLVQLRAFALCGECRTEVELPLAQYPFIYLRNHVNLRLACKDLVNEKALSLLERNEVVLLEDLPDKAGEESRWLPN